MYRTSLLVLAIMSTLVIHSSEAGQVCAACTDILHPDDCQHHVRCGDDEECYIRRFVNESGTNLYELGCSATQACYYSSRPIIGKRDSGKHFKCLSCCNNTALCNQFSDCILPKDNPLMCASCSRMSRPADCQNKVQCDKDEKCYIHKYKTESGSTLYDLGCITSQACPPSPSVRSVKQRDVYHLKCMACCSNDMCNRNLACNEPQTNQTATATTHPLPTSTVNTKPRDCSEVGIVFRNNGSYRIYPDGFSAIGLIVYCEFNVDGAWTVIQRRVDGSVDFYRNWTDYKKGFGDVNGNVWIGNDAIHYLTTQGNYRLKIRLTDWSNITKYALYSTFRVADESHGYRLNSSGYSGIAGDHFDGNTYQFSTRDVDHDTWSDGNCATRYHSGWWYWYCTTANLNGDYIPSSYDPNETGIYWWGSWHRFNYSFNAVIMLIQRK